MRVKTEMCVILEWSTAKMFQLMNLNVKFFFQFNDK